jgi:hypothetical protein
MTAILKLTLLGLRPVPLFMHLGMFGATWFNRMMVVMMLSVTVAVLSNTRRSFVSASSWGCPLRLPTVAQFGIFLFKSRFSFDTMTPVAQRFWIGPVRIVPGRRPGCATRPRIGSATYRKGRDQALGLFTATGRALRLSNSARGL